MDQINNWNRRISEGKIDGALQREIADHLLLLLDQKKNSLGTREKLLFAQAVTSLSTAINSIYQPNETGLRRCLFALREIMIPPELLEDSNAAGLEEAKNINYDMLVSTIKILQGQIS